MVTDAPLLTPETCMEWRCVGRKHGWCPTSARCSQMWVFSASLDAWAFRPTLTQLFFSCHPERSGRKRKRPSAKSRDPVGPHLTDAASKHFHDSSSSAL